MAEETDSCHCSSSSEVRIKTECVEDVIVDEGEDPFENIKIKEEVEVDFDPFVIPEVSGNFNLDYSTVKFEAVDDNFENFADDYYPVGNETESDQDSDVESRIPKSSRKRNSTSTKVRKDNKKYKISLGADKIYICKACPKIDVFSDHRSFVQHFKDIHWYDDLSDDFLWEMMVKFHEPDKKDENICIVNPDKLKVEKYGSMECAICGGMKFEEQEMYRDHIENFHNQTEFRCSQCQATFKKYYLKRLHMHKHRSKLSLDLMETLQTNKNSPKVKQEVRAESLITEDVDLTPIRMRKDVKLYKITLGDNKRYICKACPYVDTFSSHKPFIQHFKEVHDYWLPDEFLWEMMVRYHQTENADVNLISVDPEKVKIEKYKALECAICGGLKFDNGEVYKHHIQIMHRDHEFKCSHSQCDFTFPKYYLKKQHMMKHFEVIFPCLRCKDKRFASQEALEAHNQSKHNPEATVAENPMSEIKFMFSEPVETAKKVRKDVKSYKIGLGNEKKYYCKACPQLDRFPDKQTFMQHFQYAHYFDLPEEFLWTLMVRFHESDKMDVDMCTVNPDILKVEKYRSLVCAICYGLEFPNYETYKEHIQVAHKDHEFRCPMCPTTFSKHYRKRAHMVKHLEKIYPCEICDRKLFPTEEALDHHMKAKHDQDGFFCQICKTGFASKQGLLQHLNTYHLQIDTSALQPDGTIKVKSEPTTQFECNFCDKVFKKKPDLDKHVTSHSTASDFQCSQCAKAFPSKSKLDYHFLTAHTAPTFQCDRCSKLFHTTILLVQHQKVHQEDFQYICEICSKGFHFKQNYNFHMESHERGTLKPKDVEHEHKCDMCPKSYKQKCHLGYHIRTIHEGAPPYNMNLKKKSYECEVCGREYNSPMGLYIHKTRAKTLHEKFECKQCSVLIYGKIKFDEHMAIHDQPQEDADDASAIASCSSQGLKMEPDSIVEKVAENLQPIPKLVDDSDNLPMLQDYHVALAEHEHEQQDNLIEEVSENLPPISMLHQL